MDSHNVKDERFFSTIRALHEAYQQQELTPLDYVRSILLRAQKLAPGIFTCLTEERALKEAELSTARWQEGKPLGLFDGVPMVWKDLYHMKDVVTTAASLAYADAPREKSDSEAVRIFTEQGGINLGKVCLSELAYSGLGINPEFSTHPNWYSRNGQARVPGGSSSGTALAVCAEMCSVGMGTDTSGSIRIPAAFHGLYGYKPADKWACQTDVFPLSFTLDRIGPIAHSLQDCYDIHCLYQQKGGGLVTNLIPPKFSIVVPTNIVLDHCSQAILEKFHAVLSRLCDQGIEVTYEKIDAMDAVFEINEKYGTFAAAESLYFHRDILNNERGQLINPRVLQRMFRGKSMSATDYVALERLRKYWIKQAQQTLEHKIILMPTVAIEAPLLQPLEDNDDLFNQTNLLVLRNTLIGNFLNWESMSIPMGKGEDAMPIGLMLSSATIQNDAFFAITSMIDHYIVK